MNTIDARGLSCPQPVILTKKILDSAPDCCEILVDNRTAVENVTRFAEHAGYKAEISESSADFCLRLKKQQ